MRARGRFLLVIVAFLALGAVGCSDDAAEDSGPVTVDTAEGLPAVSDDEFVDMTGQSEIVIDARDNTFVPQFVTVSPGTEITFDNTGRTAHNVIPVDDSQFAAIPTDDLQPGDTAVLTFDDPGLYPYYCSLHGTPSAGMDGRIRIAEA